MPRPPLWYLQKIELFSTLSEEEIDELIMGIMHKEYNSKEVLFKPEDTIENTYILKEGEVTLYQLVDGKKVIIDILKPGSIFGNIGFDAQHNEGVYAETSQQAFVCTLPKDFFIQMMKRNPSVALRAFTVLSKRISQYQSQLRYLSVLNAEDRILATINLLNEKEDQSILPAILRKPTKITHEKLASMTGLTRETVTKQLQKLVDDGLIQIDRKHIRLTDEGKKHMEEI